MHIKPRYKAVVIVLLLAVPFVLLANGLGQNDVDDTFDPATYGIPDEIAGYQVLAVKTKENTVCFGGASNRVNVVLRAPQTDMASGILNNNTDEVRRVLNQIDPNKDWQLSLLSPNFTANYVISSIKANNKFFARSGCIVFGDFVVPTPTITSDLPTLEE